MTRRAKGNGILYTCHAGHIDVAHARKAADWTGFLAALTLDGLSQYGFSTTVRIEPRVWEASRIRKARHGNSRPSTRKLDSNVRFSPLIHHIQQAGAGHRHLDTDALWSKEDFHQREASRDVVTEIATRNREFCR